MLTKLVVAARKHHASDLHIEPGLPPTMRVAGALRRLDLPAIPAPRVQRVARDLVPSQEWSAFRMRGSFDTAALLGGVPCRLSIFQTSRGIALAVRLLASRAPTLQSLNLHPALADLVRRTTGLVIVSGPTGSGKSSTVAALVSVLNAETQHHVLTVEQPIEFFHRPDRALIRQREVGRDTPSFEQALVDAMRGDPDVIVVGEMRRRETMQLTLDAADTGHLVLATMHASSPVEALQRLVAAFPADVQPAVRAQLAQSLAAVISQRLERQPGFSFRVPECEVLVATDAVRAVVRDGQLHQLTQFMTLGTHAGMWTLERYRAWLSKQPAFRPPHRHPQGEPWTPPPRPTREAGPNRPIPAAPSLAEGALSIDSDGDLEGVIAALRERDPS